MTEMVALGVQPSTFDPMKALLVASQLRQADAQNTIANLTIQDRQDAKNGLAEYSRMDAAGDPGGAMRALTKASPQMAMHIMQLKKSGLDLDNEETQQKLVRNGRAAMAVAGMPEGPERDAEWQRQLDIQRNRKDISPEQHASLSRQKPNSLMLNRIVMNGLSLEQYIAQSNRQEDKTAGKEVLGRLGAAYGGPSPDAANPNANRTVPQAMSGAISPLNGVDPSQGYTDSYTPLAPTPRVTPQQVAQARTQPQLDPNSGMVTPAIPPVPYMAPVGPNGDNAIPSATPIGGFGAAAVAPPVGGAAPVATTPPTPRTVAAAQSGPITMQPKIADTDKIPLLIAAAGMPGIPESVQKVATELLKNEHKDTKVLDDTKQRLASVMAMGLDPRSPMMQSFILSGKMPREDQQLLTATDKKAIMEADEHVMTNEASIAKLKEAKLVSKDAYTGPLAAQRGYAMSLLGSKAGEQTSNLHNLVTSNALDSLKSIFGAAPTEGERKILLDIQGSTSQPDKVRQEIYDRAIGAAERRLEFNRKRAKELREGTMYKPDGSGRVTTDQPTPPPGFDLVK